MIGKTISHYQIIGKLGSGGMGVVYEALDTKLNRTVALKFLPPDSAVNSDAKKRFLQEAQAASALDHPNICTIHEISEFDGRMFIAMARYDGELLEDRIKRGPLAGKEILEIIRQIAEGMGKAHEIRIVHRDLKPGNIIITPEGTVKIVDFGLAMSAGATRLTKTGSSIGTLVYMSPEQVGGQEITHSTDIWALGVMIYEMMEGRVPFQADYEAGIVYGIAHKEPDPPELKNPSEGDEVIEQRLRAICGKALAKDPANRYVDFAEMLDDMDALEPGPQLSSVSRFGGRAKAQYWHRRFVLPVGVLVALVVSAILWIQQEPVPDSQNPVRSVAVLPLRDISIEGSSERLTLGLTDGIVSGLSRVNSVSVISRRSAAKAAESDLSIPEIAEKLGADVVFDGSFTREGNHIKLTATLVDGASDRNIWVSDFECELEDLFSLQNEIALAIATGIGAESTPRENAAFATVRTVAPAAMEEYLEAKLLWEQRSSKTILASIEIYQRILALHPDFAEAWVGLAEAQTVLPSYSRVGIQEAYTEARRCALRAIEIDQSLAGAWNVLSEVAYIFDLDYPESERLRKKSLEYNASSATAHQWYSEFLSGMGRHDEALAEIEIAQRLDPLSPLMMTTVGGTLTYARRYDEAIEVLRQVNSAYPDFVLATSTLQRALSWAKRYEEAGRAIIKWQLVGGASGDRIGQLQDTFEKKGYRGVRNLLLQDLVERHQAGEFVQARSLASGYAEIGDTEESLYWLEKSLNNRDIALLRLKVNANFDGMRDDPRFIDLMSRIGFGTDD